MPANHRSSPTAGSASTAGDAETNQSAGQGQVTGIEDQIVLILQRLESLDERIRRLEPLAKSSTTEPSPAAAALEHTMPSSEHVHPPVAPKPADPVAAGRAQHSMTSPSAVTRRPEPPAHTATSQRVSKPRKSLDLESLIGGQVLAWVGGLSLLLGALFFLSLAFSRGWVGPSERVVIGLAFGAALMLGGIWFFERRERVFGHVLVAVGLGILSMALYAATPSMYGLVRIEIALLGVLIAAVAAATIAIRADSQVVAAYGLIAALVAPPLVGATPNGTTIAYMSAILVGTTAIALYRSWRWLPPLAFLLSVPQLADWVWSDPSKGVVLVALGGFWLLHAVAAGGEEFRVRRNRLSTTSTTLLVANAAFLVWAGFVTLDGNAESWRGLYLLTVALAHFALGGYFLYQEGDRHPFGMLAFGTGVAAVTIAIPVQMGGPYVAIAWAAQAVALAWVYVDRRHGYSGLVASILGALACAHLVTVEYPLWEVQQWSISSYPFLNGSGGTLVFLLGAMTVAGYLLSDRGARVTLASLALLLVTYVLPFELSGLWLLASWSSVFVLSVAIWRLFPDRPALADLSPLALPTVVSGSLSLGHMLLHDIRLGAADWALPPTPFWNSETAAALIVISASLLAGFISRVSWGRRAGIILAASVTAYLIPFQLTSPAIVVAWSAVAFLLGLVAWWDRSGRLSYLVSAGFLVALGTGMALLIIAPPTRLVVDETSQIGHALFWSGSTAALGALVIVLGIGYWVYREQQGARWLALIAGVLAVYLLSVGVIDEFQSNVGGVTEFEELQKQAQVALSILWALLGGGVFIAGILRGVMPARVFGLSLLALTTSKVFLYDMSSLDAAYRVLSFIGLGILLLLSAYAYQHFTPGGGVKRAAA